MKTLKKQQPRKISLDITGHDRTTIIWKIRSMYRLGYNEIALHYNNTDTTHLRRLEKVLVRDVIRDQVVKMLGARIETIDAHNSILYVEHQNASVTAIIERIIRRIIDLHAEFILLCQGHLYAATMIEDNHDSLTKLVTYCQLLISEKQTTAQGNVAFHFLACVDKVADIIKYMARDYTTFDRPMSKTSIGLYEKVQEYLALYERVHLKGRLADINELMLMRDDIKRQMRASIKTMDSREAFLMGQETSMMEILADMFESTMTLRM
jgi:hypothetical protein